MEKQKIMDEVQKEKNILPDLSLGNLTKKEDGSEDTNVADKANDLVDAVALQSVEGVGNLLGVDLTNPEQTDKKLEEIKENLTDPENVERIKEIAEGASEVGQIALEASQPFIDDFVDKSVETAGKAASKIGESGVKILLNTAEEIPGVGIVFGTIRSIGNAGEAVISTVNAGAEVAETYADSVNAATKNFNRLMEEKGLINERTEESVKEFQNQFKQKADSQLKAAKDAANNKVNSSVNNAVNETTKKGGTRRLIKHKKNKKNKKSKRVKFNI